MNDHKRAICKKCHKACESYKMLKSHWYDDHADEFKVIEHWLEKDVDELRRLEQTAAEGMKGYFAGVPRKEGD